MIRLFFVIAVLLCSSAHAAEFQNETLLKRDGVIWGFDFLPDGRILYTVRSGEMAIFDPKTKQSVKLSGIPAVHSYNQGGLLDVRVHPDFSKNQFVFFTYSEPLGGDFDATAVGRAKLSGNALSDFKKLIVTQTKADTGMHYGSRIVFQGPYLFFAVGERNQRHEAQKLTVHNGKVLRINQDGTVPKDNPFANKKDVLPEIWSFGHRNPQGLTSRPGTSEIWEAEFGPRGGDEINLIKPGANYGWPEITYGREYYGPKIGEYKKEGMEQPIEHWVPSISPSGLAFYDGNAFPKWKGNLFLACLSSTQLLRLELSGTKVTKQEKVIDGNRFRSVRTGPDGFVYYSTDEGTIGRLRPAQ
jgi:glucose/arabinose dehydrogenase